MTRDQESSQKSLIDLLCETLISISQNHYQHIENPVKCSKRASVALIIRTRPSFNHWPEDEINQSDSNIRFDIKKFFTLPWVQQGDPEIAFIKRAAREGDRWTNHVALPGGKRDSEDLDDKNVAIRETAEEIGLDLSLSDALYIGNLPDRLVQTAWGTFPIMVLCPFVFLWTKATVPPLKLQPGEVASLHWVPLRTLLSPSSRTYKYVHTSDRFVQKGGILSRTILRYTLGLMQFSAVRLLPSESLYCSSTKEFFPKENLTKSEHKTSFISKIIGQSSTKWNDSFSRNEPLLLWGLTLGILVDFLNQLSPYNAMELWSYPTFTNYDARLIISILTMSLKRRNKSLLRIQSSSTDQSTIDTEIEKVPIKDFSFSTAQTSDQIKILQEYQHKNQSDVVGIMLDGYYDKVRRGAIIAISLRTIGALSIMFIILKKYIKIKHTN
ncbi:Uncharacterized protein C14C4.10c [Golovinomyces cichoracearum]|uniref:Uncharacterized protein C14C4.10c n=1 Tax=Golovinomyces cichoracearum TaxID=62708 RepID=A0A420HCE6_9PEZI|nr:Uncharacterized protein C14C4.10c [Golovinomyces cichoracearum]